MAFWILEKRGHGKCEYLVAKQISSKKAKELESKDVEVFDNKEDAKAEANRLRGN